MTSSGNGEMVVICVYPPHREKGTRHVLKDCRACPQEGKPKTLPESLNKRKPGTGRKDQLVRQDSLSRQYDAPDKSSIVFHEVFF